MYPNNRASQFTSAGNQVHPVNDVASSADCSSRSGVSLKTCVCRKKHCNVGIASSILGASVISGLGQTYELGLARYANSADVVAMI